MSKLTQEAYETLSDGLDELAKIVNNNTYESDEEREAEVKRIEEAQQGIDVIGIY